MKQPRLLILSFSNISADARVLKQVELFADRYDLTTCGYGPSPHPKVEHVQLSDAYGIREWRRFDLILRRFRRIYWNQPAIRQALTDLASSRRFDAILANDIDAIGLALALEPLCGVHADIHEYAPRQNEEIATWRIFIAPYVRWMCRSFLPRTESMTTVGTGIANEYRRVYGVKPEVVTNASPFAELEPSPVDTQIRLVHSGASIRNRRLEVLVNAVLETTSDVSLDLYLMGNDPDYVAHLKSIARGSDRIRFPEPVTYRQLVSKLNEYDVGIHVIAPTNFNNRWALPNKFFDYVQARLGVIIGPTLEMRGLLERYELGAVADGFGTRAVTEVLNSITRDDVRVWKANANLAAHPLSAEAQVQVWNAAIESMTQRDRP